MSENGLLGCPIISPYKAYVITQEHDTSAIRAILEEAVLKNCPATPQWIRDTAEDTWRKVRGISTDTLNTIGRVVDYLEQKPGKRTLLLASAGFMAGTLQEQRDRVVDHARRAGVVIHALDAKGLYAEMIAGTRPGDFIAKGPTGPPPSYIKAETMAVSDRALLLNEPMAELAEKTGGVFIHDNNDPQCRFPRIGHGAGGHLPVGFQA
jgi:hypothetical protein